MSSVTQIWEFFLENFWASFRCHTDATCREAIPDASRILQALFVRCCSFASAGDRTQVTRITPECVLQHLSHSRVTLSHFRMQPIFCRLAAPPHHRSQSGFYDAGKQMTRRVKYSALAQINELSLRLLSCSHTVRRVSWRYATVCTRHCFGGYTRPHCIVIGRSDGAVNFAAVKSAAGCLIGRRAERCNRPGNRHHFMAFTSARETCTRARACDLTMEIKPLGRQVAPNNNVRSLHQRLLSAVRRNRWLTSIRKRGRETMKFQASLANLLCVWCRFSKAMGH